MKRLCIKIIMISFYLLISQSIQAETNKDVFAKYPNKYFIETGSWIGGGIQMAIDTGFKNIYSIELGENIYKDCCKRFAPYTYVKLFLGNSSEVLPIILKEIDAPATFWLDGHYSGLGTAKGQSNTPLLAELEHIAQHYIKTHTILIDDVRLLGTQDMDYITLEHLIDQIRLINPEYEFIFEDGHISGDVLVAIVRK